MNVRDLALGLMLCGGGSKTASGPVASFTAKKAKPLRSLLVSVDFVQAGSGDPNPTDNVRPISGRTEAKIFREAAYDASAAPRLTVAFPAAAGTVYGGTLDVTSGVLRVNRALIVMDGSVSVYGMTYSSSTGLYGAIIANGIRSVNTAVGDPHIWSNRFKSHPAVAVGNAYVTGAGKTIAAILPDQTITTKAQAEAWFADNPTQFVYDLAEPVAYELTPQELITLAGANCVWADSGGIAVTYRSGGGTKAALLRSLL